VAAGFSRCRFLPCHRAQRCDFLQSFYGDAWPGGGAPQVKTYTKEGVFAALNRTAPYDWRSFFETRLTSLSPHAPLGGLEKSGWRVVYNATPSAVTHTFMYSLGIAVGGDSTVIDIERGGSLRHRGTCSGNEDRHGKWRAVGPS
jgi:predicted metalloprotease with PDZ domain